MHDDPTLFRRWRDAQDETAFAEIARRHADLVVDVARCVAGDRLTAEDALQQALLRLALETTDRPALVGVRAWLAAAALGVARNARTAERRRAVRERVSSERRTSVERSPTADGSVDAWLHGLDGEERALLRLRYAYGLDTDELAEVYGARSGTVRVRLHRALERLRADAPPKRVRALLVASLGARGLGVSQTVVHAATRSALATASSATASGTVGLIASQAVRPSALHMWVAGGAVAALLGTAAWWLGTESRSGAVAQPAPRAAAEDPAGERAMLLAHGGRARRSADPLGEPLGEGAGDRAAALPPPVRRTDSPVVPAPDLRHARTRVRVLLGDSDEALPIGPRALWNGVEQHVVDPADASVAVKAGVYLTVMTADPRVEFEGTVTILVPDPVPAVLVMRAAESGDARLETVTLRVVDAATRAPLSAAYVDLGRYVAADKAVLHADSEGRIRVDRETVARMHDGPDLRAVHVAGAVPFRLLLGRLHAPDHTDAETGWATGPTDAHLRTWRSAGEVEVGLRGHPPGGEAVTVRFVRAGGVPVTDLYVEGWTPGMQRPIALRPDGEGIVRWKRAPPEFALAAYERGACARIFVLSREETRGTGLRSILLPPLVPVDVEIEAPDASDGRWSGGNWLMEADVLDGLAANHVLGTGYVTTDGSRGLSPLWSVLPMDSRARVLSDSPTLLRFLLPPGVRSDLWISTPDFQTRRVSLTPREGEPRLVRRWDDLPSWRSP